MYGTRADVGVTTVAAALALAFRSLETTDVGLAELTARLSLSIADAAPRAAPSTNGENAGKHARHVAIQGTGAALVRRSDGVWTLAVRRGKTPAVSDAKAVTVALEAMRDRFAVSVAELGHQVNERTLAAFDVADRIVIVTEGAVPSLRGTQRVLRLCQRLNYPDEKMCVVVNRFDAPGALPPADIAIALRREVYWKIPTGATLDVAGLATRLVER